MFYCKVVICVSRLRSVAVFKGDLEMLVIIITGFISDRRKGGRDRTEMQIYKDISIYLTYDIHTLQRKKATTVKIRTLFCPAVSFFTALFAYFTSLQYEEDLITSENTLVLQNAMGCLQHCRCSIYTMGFFSSSLPPPPKSALGGSPKPLGQIWGGRSGKRWGGRSSIVQGAVCEGNNNVGKNPVCLP